MKTIRNIGFLVIFFTASFKAFGQARSENYFAQKWLFDINFPVGVSTQKATAAFTPNFTYPVNTKFEGLRLSPAAVAGIDVEGGYYIGKKKLFGFGTGIQYLQSISHITLDNYHVEYQATDGKNQVFRQVVSSVGPITENLNNNAYNIPIVIKYKQVFSKRIGISADAGILINTSNSTTSFTNSGFNYEAIYAYANSGSVIHVYDNNPTPNATDWLITVQQYQSHNQGGSVENYFDSLRLHGYKVGLDQSTSNPTSKIIRPGSSLGFIFRPAVNIRIYQRLYIYFGGFLSYQMFNNSVSQKYRLTDNLGATYSSLLNTVSSVTTTTLGGNIGARVFLGRSDIYLPHKDD